MLIIDIKMIIIIKINKLFIDFLGQSYSIRKE